MQVIHDVSGQNTPVLKKFLIYGGAADIAKGALVQPGPLSGPGTIGAVVVATAAAPESVVGVLTQLHDYSVAGDWTYNGTLTTATNRPEADVDIRPGAICQIQIMESNDLTAYNTNDTTETGVTTADATGADDDLIGGGWIYDDTTEQLNFIEDHSAANTLALNTATTTAITNASNTKCVIIPPRLYGAGANQGATLDSTYARVYIDTDETTEWMKVLDVMVEFSNKIGPERLNPGIHDAAKTESAKCFAEIVIGDHFLKEGSAE